MTDGWFPQIGPNGHVARGSETITINNRVVGPGVQPVWLAPETILYRDRETPRLWMAFLDPARALIPIELPRGANYLWANEDGAWCAFCGPSPGRPTPAVLTSAGKLYEGFYAGVWTADSVILIDGQGVVRRNGTESISRGPARELAYREGHLAWIEERERYRPRVAPPAWGQALVAHRAVPVPTPRGLYVLLLEDDRLVLQRRGSAEGIVVHVGETFYPDARYLPHDDHMLVIWSDGRGRPGGRAVSLNEPHIDLRRQSASVHPFPTPTPMPEPTSLLPTVVRERARYGTPMTPAQLGELLNAIAWEHRADGWGLSRKPSGHSVPGPGGQPIASDILHHRPTNTLYDVLRKSESDAAPVWQHVGPPPSPDRTWVAPIAPHEAPPPPPPPPPPDDPLEARVAALEAWARSFRG